METATAQIETSKENETPSATMNTDFSSDHALGGILEGTTLVEYEGMGDGGVDISIPEEKEDESELRVEEEDEEGIPNPEPESPAVTIVHALQLSSPQQLADTEQHHDPDQQQDTEPADRNVTLQLSEATHFILTSLDYVSKRLQGVEVRVDGVEGRMVGSERVVEGGTARERETAFCVPFERKGDFGGREEEIGSLMGRWRKGDRARVGVVGLGGIGKTDLVLEFVYRLKHIASTTPIFWFRPEDICTNERVPSTAAAGTQLDEWIKAEYSSDCVLVVDTGDNFHPIIMHPKRLLDKLDGFAGTLVLVARSAYDVRQLAGLHGIYEVPALDLSAATTIFKRQLNTFAQSTTTYAQLQEVCHLLTCNPRGLIQIAPTINQTGLKVSQFLELYQKSDSNKLRLFSTLVPVVTATHSDQAVFGKGVFDMAAFRSSFPDAPSKILYQLYYLGATSIPKSIFSAMDALEMIFALHILLSHHLLSEDIATQTLTLHPLVYLTLHSHLRRRHTLETSSSVLQHQTWHEETILLFSRRYPDAKVENRSWWKDTFTHLLTNLPLHSDALKTAISTIYHREAAFFKRRGMYTEALKMAVLSRNALPESVPGTMVHILQSHAALLEKLGRYRELQNTLEKFDRDVDVEKGGMVWIWRERVRARLAVHLEPGDNHAVSFGVFMSTDLANAEKYDSALRQHDLAGVLMLRGAYREAEIAARQALMERERSVGSEHANMLTSCHYLAEISLLGGKFEQGMGYVHTAIVGREKVLGLAHPETVLSRALNGRILLSRAVTLLDLAEAEQVIEGSRERLASVLGAKHPTVLATQQDIGTSMMRRGDYTSAEHLFSSVLKAREEFWGLEQNNHPEILASRHALAELTFLKDGPETAETMVETLVKQRTTALGESHPSTLDSTLLQARIFSAISKHDLAREAIESVVRHCSIFLSSTHPSTALASSHRAEILRVSFTTPSCATPPLQPELCLAKEITALSSRAYTMLAHLYGSEHHLALQAATHLALALSPPHLSDAHSGLGSTHAFRHIYTAYFRSLGKMHPETLQAQVRLGEALGTAALRAGSSSIGVRIDKELVEEARHHWREGLSGLGSENWVAERAWRRFEGFIGELERRSGNERVLGVKVERKEEGIEWKGEMEWEGESRKGETVTGRGT